MVFLIFGQPESGKTTLANNLKKLLQDKYRREAYVIDGDDIRKILRNKDYTKNGRYNNIKTANSIAIYLDKITNKDVIMSLVNPYEELRGEFKETCEVMEIFLESERKNKLHYHVKDFEKPKNPDLHLDTSRLTIEQTMDIIEEELGYWI